MGVERSTTSPPSGGTAQRCSPRTIDHRFGRCRTERRTRATVPMTNLARLKKTLGHPDLAWLVQRMRAAASLLEQQMAQADSKRDMIRRSCLDGKRILVLGGVHVGQRALAALKAAVAARDTGAAAHEWSKLVVADQRVGEWAGQAGDCFSSLSGCRH